MPAVVGGVECATEGSGTEERRFGPRVRAARVAGMAKGWPRSDIPGALSPDGPLGPEEKGRAREPSSPGRWRWAARRRRYRRRRRAARTSRAAPATEPTTDPTTVLVGVLVVGAVTKGVAVGEEVGCGAGMPAGLNPGFWFGLEKSVGVENEDVVSEVNVEVEVEVDDDSDSEMNVRARRDALVDEEFVNGFAESVLLLKCGATPADVELNPLGGVKPGGEAVGKGADVTGGSGPGLDSAGAGGCVCVLDAGVGVGSGEAEPASSPA